MKEQFLDAADTTPVSLQDLKRFVAEMEQESGLNIEIPESMQKDDWALDLLTNESFVSEIKQHMNETSDLFTALLKMLDKPVTHETDHDMY